MRKAMKEIAGYLLNEEILLESRSAPVLQVETSYAGDFGKGPVFSLSKKRSGWVPEICIPN